MNSGCVRRRDRVLRVFSSGKVLSQVGRHRWGMVFAGRAGHAINAGSFHYGMAVQTARLGCFGLLGFRQIGRLCWWCIVLALHPCQSISCEQ